MALTGAQDDASRLVETYSPMLLRLACTRLETPADAEDVVQEVFLKLLTARPAFRDEEHEKAWLIRTTLHRAADLKKA
ncbi:MAG: RNA polymerase sigma factor, partial [Oscillospiraceae bacterium]|nr:RNA polymerase sigma factor [Oscillospiraceae bacterium]